MPCQWLIYFIFLLYLPLLDISYLWINTCFFCAWLASFIWIMFPKFIHILACISTSLLFTANYYFTVWIPLFVHLFISWWPLGCFHCFAVMNKTAMNICIQVLCGDMFSILLDIPLWLGFLGHIVTLWSYVLTYWGTARLLSKVA